MSTLKASTQPIPDPNWRTGIREIEIIRIDHVDSESDPLMGLHGSEGDSIDSTHIPVGKSPWTKLPSILERTNNPYILFFQYEYQIADFALLQLQQYLNDSPRQPDLLYFDEDRLTLDGQRVAPFFKPGYSPDRLRNQDYIVPVITI